MAGSAGRLLVFRGVSPDERLARRAWGYRDPVFIIFIIIVGGRVMPVMDPWIYDIRLGVRVVT